MEELCTFLGKTFNLPSLPWVGIEAYIFPKCSQFTKHLGWTPASFCPRGSSSFAPDETFLNHFSHGKYGSLFVFMKGVCFTVAFQSKRKTN